MTAQVLEVLHYKGEKYAMATEPLGQYFALAGIKPPFEPGDTSLWRGYVGTWEIRDDRLYLVGLNGRLPDCSRATVATVFPGFADRVFAHWFSGEIRAPHGKLVQYVHAGYGSTYERDHIIQMSKGTVVSATIRENPPAPPRADLLDYRKR